MGKIIDLTNQKFGYLTVINKTDKRGPDRSVIQHCKCDCGNEIDVPSTRLRSGNTKSCGCYQKERISQTHLKIIPNGTRFGKLVVLELLPERSNTGLALYKCQCDCGKTCIVSGHNLRSGSFTQSCGCLKRNIFKQEVDESEIGKKYGKLKVLSISKKQDNNKQHYLTCQCECGNIIDVNLSHLHSGHTISCGCIKSKGEIKIIEILKKNNIPFITQYHTSNCKYLDTNYYAYFDFFVNNKYIIEYDGSQHYFAKESGQNNKKNLEKIQEHDIFKNQYCKEHNIPLIRIPYTHYNLLCIEDLIPETSKFLVE